MRLLRLLAVPIVLGLVAGVAKAQAYKPMSEQKEKTAAVLKAVKAMEKKGRGMEKLRASGITADMQICGQQMRKLQPETKLLRKETESLPIDILMPLSAAAIELQLCVSCASRAMESCNRAKEHIRDAEKVLKTPWKQRREIIGDVTNQ
jgi:uncharacterized coiled-coil DUF342 family protein